MQDSLLTALSRKVCHQGSLPQPSVVQWCFPNHIKLLQAALSYFPAGQSRGSLSIVADTCDEVRGPYVVTLLDLAPVFKWYMARLAFENRHQKGQMFK